jgi:hypothetical protein
MYSMDIIAKELITYEVGTDGSWFRMNFSTADGERGSLRLPTECLQALIMTLPTMMTQALRAQHEDESLRLVYTAGLVDIEGARDSDKFILTLTTPDDFAVSFCVTRQQLTELNDSIMHIK